MAETQTCKQCDSEKPLSAFSLTPAGNPRSICKDCHRANRRRTYALDYAKNPEKYRAKGRRAKQRQSPEQKTAINLRDYLVKKSRANYRPKLLKRLKSYRDRNPAKYREYKANYRAKKLQATPSWADRDKIKQIYKLAVAEKKLTGKPVNVDHIVPLKSPIVCGLHVHYNLQITIDSYNNRKNNRVWPEMP